MDLGLLLFEQMGYLVARLVGYFPGRLFRFGSREARRLMGDWSHQGLTGRYEVMGSPHDFEALLANMELPVFALSFSDDNYAPLKAVLHLLGKVRLAPMSHFHLSPSDMRVTRLGHFGWIKCVDGVADRIMEWIRRVRE